jgi:multidrug resistance protein
MSWLGAIATTITAFTAGSYAAGIDQMTAEWHVSKPFFQVGIAVFTAGFAIAPMFLAPFSEINGRRPVFIMAGTLFTLFQLTCALTPTFPGMIVARFLVGCSCSVFSTMVGGVIADFYHREDRNWAMALFTGGAMSGTGLGPLVSGFIAQHTTWRW